MFMSWKFLTILFIAGLIRENFGFIHQQDTDDVVPSSKKFNLESDSDLQPPKGLQIAKGLGQARFKFLKNAKNLKMRLANKRNNLKGLLPSQRDRQSPPEALNKFNAGNNKNINGFDDVMESSKNNYFYQYPDMVGDRFNNNDNLNRNRMWTNLERSSEEEENIFSPKIHKYSPTAAVRHNRPDSNNDNFSKNWWENQDASRAVSPSSHFHNNEYHDTLQSRHYSDDENYNSNSDINSLEMNSFENRNSNGNKFSKSNQQLQSAFGVEEDDGDIFEQIRKAATAANAKELKRNGRQNRMESSDYNNDQSFYRMPEENAKRNAERSAYRTIIAPTYSFQHAEPFVWYGFDGDKPYPLGSINQQYRVPENFQSMEPNSEMVGADKKKLKKLKKLKKHKLEKLRTWTDSDNMEHLYEDNQNVHPVIMQEYVQSMHGHSNIPSSTNYKSNFFKSQSEPLKIEMFDNDSKLLANQKSANDNDTQEDELNQKNQESQLAHDLNNEDMIMAKAISLAAMKLAKIEERLENENQQRIKAEQQTGKEVWKTNEDRVMQPSDPRIVMMTLKAKELDKMQNDKNAIRDDPIVTRYLVTDESKEWTNTRALPENSKKGDGNKKLNDKSKLSNDDSKMFMRKSPEDKNIVTSQHQINIPHSGITVFEPTRIMHYHSSGPPVELANSGKIPVFEEPQTIIKVNTVADVEQQKSLPETQRSMPLQTNDGNKMYAMQFGYNLNNPQIPVFYHQPAYRWPVVNTEPLTYTYNGVQYKFVNPAVPNNSNDPVLMSIGPQIPAHSSLLRPGNLFGLTRYNSGYGGPFGRLSYYQALLNKQRQHLIEPRYNDYDYDNDASNKIETFVAPEKKTPNLENSEDVHYITKRDVQQPHHDHQRHKRSTETETCPCFKYPFHGPRRFDPAYQSSAMSPYRSDYRLAFKRSVRNKREIENEKNTETEENTNSRKQRHVDRQNFLFSECGTGGCSKFGSEYVLNRKDRASPYVEQESSFCAIEPYQDPYGQMNSYPQNQPFKEITLKANDDPNEILRSIQQHNEQAVREALSKAGSDPLQIGGGSVGGSIVLNEADIKSGAQQQIYDPSNSSPINLQADQSGINNYAVQAPPIQSEYIRNYQPEILPMQSSHYPAIRRQYQEQDAPRKYSLMPQPTSIRYSNPFISHTNEQSNYRPSPQNCHNCHDCRSQHNTMYNPPPPPPPPPLPPAPAPAPLPAMPPAPLPAASSPYTQPYPVSPNYPSISPTDIYARNYVHPLFAYNPKSTTEPSFDPAKLFNIPDATGESFKQLLDAIKSKLLACCEKCKKKILRGIHEKIDDEENDGDITTTTETVTTTSYEDLYPTPACSSCKTASNIYNEVENLSRDLWNDEIEIRRKSGKSSRKSNSISDRKRKLRKLIHHLTQLRKLSCEESSSECRTCSSERVPYIMYSTEQSSIEIPSTKRSTSSLHKKKRGSSKSNRPRRTNNSNDDSVVRNSRKASSNSDDNKKKEVEKSKSNSENVEN